LAKPRKDAGGVDAGITSDHRVPDADPQSNVK
jgi:hypothetical protein